MSSEIARKAPRVTFSTTGPSRAKQSFKEECDINNVMRRFERTGVLEHVNRFEGSFGDFGDVPQDYQEAVNQVLAAQEMFMSLPARLRARFGNDPGRYVAFVQDPENVDELVRLGMASLREPPLESSTVAGRADTRPSDKRTGPPGGGAPDAPAADGGKNQMPT